MIPDLELTAAELLAEHTGNPDFDPAREMTVREAFAESDRLAEMISNWWRDGAIDVVDLLCPVAFSNERRERLLEIAEVAARGHRDAEAAVSAAIAVYLVGATPVVIA